MPSLGIVTAIFTENLITVLGLAAFGYSLFEFCKRRKTHILLFSLNFLGIAIAYGSWFVAQMLDAYGLNQQSLWAVRVFWLVNAIDSALLACAIVGLVAGKLSRRRQTVIAAICLLPIIFVVSGRFGRTEIGYMSFPLAIGPALFVSIGYRVLVDGLLVLMPFLRRGRNGGVLMSPPELHLSLAGLFGLLSVLTGFVAFAFSQRYFIILALATFLVREGCLFFGALAIEHPDKRIAAAPGNIIGRSLIAKVTVFMVGIFWLLAFTLVVATSGYFVESSVRDLRNSVQRDVHGLSKSYAGFKALLLEQTTRLAERAQIDIIEINPSKPLPPQFEEFLGIGRRSRIIRLVDTDGIIRYSSWSSSEIGTSLADSAVVRQALAGKRSVSAEIDRSQSQWTVRAAAPFAYGIGRRAVIITTDISEGIDFSDFIVVAAIKWTGSGFISGSSSVYAVGELPDEVTKSFLRKSFSTGSATAVRIFNGTFYALERPASVDGIDDGYFYVSVAESTTAHEVIRIVSVVLAIVIVIVSLLTLVVVLSAIYVLKPVRALRQASERVEDDHYDFVVAYDSSDELGQMARAFNRMSATIGDRTAKLRQSVLEQRDFLEHIAHEMRTPLNVFRWTIEMMRYGDTGRLSREQLELIGQLHQTTRRLILMVQNLTDAAHLVQGNLTLRCGPAVLEDIIDEVAGNLAVRIREKNINLHWNRPKRPWPKVYGDQVRLSQMLLNVIGNAVKYSHRNGHVEIIGKERSDSGPGGHQGKYLELTVEDSGRGIPRSLHDRVFTRFFRSADVVGQEIEGTGLGLFIVKELVERHGGRIWFESEEGTGSAFHLTLPLEIEKPPTAPKADAPSI